MHRIADCLVDERRDVLLAFGRERAHAAAHRDALAELLGILHSQLAVARNLNQRNRAARRSSPRAALFDARHGKRIESGLLRPVSLAEGAHGLLRRAHRVAIELLVRGTDLEGLRIRRRLAQGVDMRRRGRLRICVQGFQLVERIRTVADDDVAHARIGNGLVQLREVLVVHQRHEPGVLVEREVARLPRLALGRCTRPIRLALHLADATLLLDFARLLQGVGEGHGAVFRALDVQHPVLGLEVQVRVDVRNIEHGEARAANARLVGGGVVGQLGAARQLHLIDHLRGTRELRQRTFELRGSGWVRRQTVEMLTEGVVDARLDRAVHHSVAEVLEHADDLRPDGGRQIRACQRGARVGGGIGDGCSGRVGSGGRFTTGEPETLERAL